MNANIPARAAAPLSMAMRDAICEVLNQIADLAYDARGLAIEQHGLAIERAGPAADDMPGMHGLIALTQKIGWLADQASDSVGGNVLLGDPAGWFLSRPLIQALQDAQGGAA
jgi:hypothetical protein